ncbi:hypothetical protein [Christiangramia aquimixticola]|uniref:hypothetical protein n=1 Tax=Christiangramia aquimixticola TaxID=1697558 RepID=UPI003AA8279D
MVPTHYRDPHFFLNSAVLQGRLNESDAFDKPMDFKNKDKLLVVFDESGEYFNYTFQYRNGNWEYVEEDPFDLMNHFKKIQKGECS